MDVKSGHLEKRREKDWKLSKCRATEEWWISNGWIELQMKKFLEDSEIEEPCGRVWGREEVRDDGAHTHTLRNGGLLRLRGWFLEGEVGKKRGRLRLNYFDQIIGDIWCEIFWEVKELAWDRAEWSCVKPVFGLCTQWW